MYPFLIAMSTCFHCSPLWTYTNCLLQYLVKFYVVDICLTPDDKIFSFGITYGKFRLSLWPIRWL